MEGGGVEGGGVEGGDVGASSTISTNSSARVSSAPCAFPSAMASATAVTNSRTERMASSLPGITKSTPLGLLFVSTTPITGMPILLASVTAMRS